MADFQRSLDDYNTVAERIAEFRDKHPEGSLRPLNPAEPWRIVQAEGYDKNGDHVMQSFVVVVAAAYRDPEDPAPGVGMAWEIFPGRTPYTRGSELMNAETSAQGRAIVAALAADVKKGVASREEVRNRQAERDDGLPTNRDRSLSRSRTTDEEKQAAGVMTAAQLKEHGRLARLDPNTQPVERLSTAEPDVWMDGPAGLTPQDDPEDRPGTASAAQLREMHALFAQLGVPKERREERLEITRKVLGLDMLSSSARLSFRQAGDLLLALRDQAKART